jgi:release factor glutamine methyltransferase
LNEKPPRGAPTAGWCTVDAGLRDAARRLGAGASSRAAAEALLAHVLCVDRSRLLAALREPLEAGARARFAALVDRHARGEPIADLTGTAAFLDTELLVTPDVLIPRPDTEVLGLWAIERAAGAEAPRVLDVGTGCGALALSVASALPTARVDGTDVSAAALQVAEANAHRLGLRNRVRFHLADLFPLGGERFDVIVANLPYVAEDERAEMDEEVLLYEPHGAVMAGPDGLAVIRRLIDGLPGRLAAGGAAGIEIGWRQGAAVSRLASASLPRANLSILKDLASRDRVVVVDTAEVCRPCTGP